MALVTAVARYLTALQCRTRKVVIALFDEEELGQVGSEEFAQFLSNRGDAIHSVHTVDQMGWDSNGDRAIELERPDTGLFELYQAAVTAGGFSIPLHETTTGYTDHVAFRPFGFDAIGITYGCPSVIVD